MAPFFPPINFNIVEDNFYRCGMPSEINFEFIKTLNLKTVVILSSNYLDNDVSRFLEEQNINVVYVENNVSANHTINQGILSFSEEMATEALKVIINKNNYPLLVTCKTGKNLTGIIIACYRKMQRWSLISIYEEFRRYSAGSKLQTQYEQFIELFDIDLIPGPPAVAGVDLMPGPVAVAGVPDIVAIDQPLSESSTVVDSTIVLPITNEVDSIDTTIILPVTNEVDSIDTTIILPVTNDVDSDTTIILPVTNDMDSIDTTIILPVTNDVDSVTNSPINTSLDR